MPHRNEFVHSDEFTRWVSEEANFRLRLETRLEAMHKFVGSELSEIKGIVKESNGRTHANSEAIAIMRRDLDALISEDQEIEKTVHSIQEQGCNQLSQHEQILTNLGWSAQKKAAVAGGLVGTGALMWPALQKLAEFGMSVLHHGAPPQ